MFNQQSPQRLIFLLGFDPTPSFLRCLSYGSLSVFTFPSLPWASSFLDLKNITFSLNIFALKINSYPVPLLCQTSGNSSCNLSPHPYISLTLYSMIIQCHYPMAFRFSKAPDNLLITKFNDFSLGLPSFYLSSESSFDLLSFPWNPFLHWLLESYATHPPQTSPIIPAHCFFFLFFRVTSKVTMCPWDMGYINKQYIKNLCLHEANILRVVRKQHSNKANYFTLEGKACMIIISILSTRKRRLKRVNHVHKNISPVLGLFSLRALTPQPALLLTAIYKISKAAKTPSCLPELTCNFSTSRLAPHWWSTCSSHG